MSSEIKFQSDKTGNDERARGSDNRLNTSARADSRAYYNSRDEGQCYSAAFDFQSATAGEFALYLKNDSSIGKDLVIDSIGINSAESSRMKLHFVSGVAAGGTDLTPTNLNGSSSNGATATAMEGGSAATGITGLTSDALIDFAYVESGGHEELRLKDRLRLGQNDAIALEYDEGTSGDVSGVVFFYFE